MHQSQTNRNKEIPWEFDGARAQIIFHRCGEVPVKTLLLSLSGPSACLSSREGLKMVRFAVNNYIPPQLWSIMHESWESYQQKILDGLGIPSSQVALLATGMDVENFALADEQFEEFRICAFVTAGVDSNAMRVGVDRAGTIERDGRTKELGTINSIVLTNAALSEKAMVRSVITATEAKTIALQDLNIRSSYNSELQATGTGTDNVVIISGRGPQIDFMGGHTKMGEMLAIAVTRATMDAVLKGRKV